MAASTYPLHGGQGAILVGATPTAVGKFQNCNIRETATVNEAKYCRASSSVVYTDGIVGREITFTALFDNSDAGQALLVTGTTVSLVFQPDNNGSGADQASCSVVISDQGYDFPMDGFYAREVTARISGDLTWGTVS